MFKSENNKEVKQKNTLYIIFKIILTTIFSLTIFVDSTLVFTEKIRGKINEIYFTDVTLRNILVFIGTWILTFLVLTLIEFVVSKIENEIYKNKENSENTGKKKRVFFIVFGVLLLLWMPYILSYFPGGVFADTKASIMQCLHITHYDNLNPLAYTLLIKICLMIGDIFKSQQLGLNIFGICQIITMAGILAYFVYWLYKKNFSNIVLVLVTLFFGVFKLIPMYALSIWKDTTFSLALFLYIINIASIVIKDGKNLNTTKQIITYVFLLLAVSFLRNNGLYVALATTIIIAIVYRKNKILKFAISALATFVLIFVVQGPIFTLLGINQNTNGTGNAVILNQIFYVGVTDGNMTEEQKEIINNMCEIEHLKKDYSPLLLDDTGHSEGFNAEFISTHKSEINKLWIELFIQNPISYIRAYLLNTLGYWDVNKALPDAYVSNVMWSGTDELIDVHQTDYVEKIMGQSIIGKIKVNKLYSSAIFLFIMLTSMIFTIKKKKYKNLLIYLPALFTWGTIVLATPIAFSMRYVYILVLMTPFNFIIPFLKNEDDCMECDLKMKEEK